jgi:hypothetical protein
MKKLIVLVVLLFSTASFAKDAAVAVKVDAKVVAASQPAQPANHATAVAKTAADFVIPKSDAPKVPETAADASGLVSTIVKAAKEKNYRELVAGIMVLLVFAWRRFGSKFLLNKLPAKAMPFVTALIGLLTAAAGGLVASSFTWKGFLVDGLTLSAEAMLFWSTLGKFVLPKVFGEIPDAPVVAKDPKEKADVENKG